MKVCISAALAELLEHRIRELAPDATIVRLSSDGTFDGDSDDIDVFCFSVDLSLNDAVLTKSFEVLQQPSLKWVQAPGAGVELPMWTEAVERGVRVTSAAGVHAEPVAQHVFAQILYWHRQIKGHQALQAEKRWEPLVSDDLTSKTLGIVGLGGIGLTAARIAKGFGMKVIATRRTPGSFDGVDQYVRPGDLHHLLSQSDYVVLALPLNDETHHMIGAAEFDAMRSDAVLINVARGPVVDQSALQEALETGAIAAASIDVTDPEPLPADSPLWTMENCFVTPHDAGYSPLAGPRLAALFLKNFQAFTRDELLTNEI